MAGASSFDLLTDPAIANLLQSLGRSFEVLDDDIIAGPLLNECYCSATERVYEHLSQSIYINVACDETVNILGERILTLAAILLYF